MRYSCRYLRIICSLVLTCHLQTGQKVCYEYSHTNQWLPNLSPYIKLFEVSKVPAISFLLLRRLGHTLYPIVQFGISFPLWSFVGFQGKKACPCPRPMPALSYRHTRGESPPRQWHSIQMQKIPNQESEKSLQMLPDLVRLSVVLSPQLRSAWNKRFTGRGAQFWDVFCSDFISRDELMLPLTLQFKLQVPSIKAGPGNLRMHLPGCSFLLHLTARLDTTFIMPFGPKVGFSLLLLNTCCIREGVNIEFCWEFCLFLYLGLNPNYWALWLPIPHGGEKPPLASTGASFKGE